MSIIRELFRSIERELLRGVSALAMGEGINAARVTSDFRPGDVNVIDVVLMSEDGQRAYSLMSQAAAIEIYESVMSPVIWADIQISDSQGLLQNFPIIGEEYIKVVFGTPLSKSVASYLLRVNSVNNKQVTQNNRKITYTLQCCSAELIENVKRQVTMKKTDTVQNVVLSIMDEYIQTDKPVFIDDTTGIEDISISNLMPFQAIDMLRQRAVSNRYESSSFCFYESRFGYHFTTFERLLDDGAKIVENGETDKVFFYDTIRNQNNENVTIRNILAYNQVSFGDSISRVMDGGLTNTVQQFDIITGDLRRLTYTDNLGSDVFKDSSSTSAAGQSTSFLQRHGESSSVSRLITTQSDKRSSDLAEKLSKSQAFAQKLSQNITQIHIYGDAEIALGDVLNVKIPSGVDTTNGRSSVSKLDSGSYTVSKIRQIITLGDRPQYSQALELIKHDLQEVA
jgi:hypothetical protein